MKRLLKLLAVAVVFLLLNGCAGSDEADKSAVKSGETDETYIGDPNPELIEEYKQTQAEAEIQAEVLKKLEEEAATESEE